MKTRNIFPNNLTCYNILEFIKFINIITVARAALYGVNVPARNEEIFIGIKLNNWSQQSADNILISHVIP